MVGAVNRMHLAHKERWKRALTSDSLGRPRPGNDTFCHLSHQQRRRKRMWEKRDKYRCPLTALKTVSAVSLLLTFQTKNYSGNNRNLN